MEKAVEDKLMDYKKAAKVYTYCEIEEIVTIHHFRRVKKSARNT